jgi:hypothetical protein
MTWMGRLPILSIDDLNAHTTHMDLPSPLEYNLQ